MTRAKPITDEHLLGLLRKIDPLGNSDTSFLSEHDEAAVMEHRLLPRILATERTGTPHGVSPRAWRGRRLAWSAATGGGFAVAATTAAIVLTAGSAPSVAFAHYAADPTVPAGGQVQEAEAECQRNPGLRSVMPTLADTRGPYTLLVYPESTGSLCVTGPSMQSPTGEPHVLSFNGFLASSVAAAQRGTATSTPAPPSTASIASSAIQVVVKAAQTIPTASAGAAQASFEVGRVGGDVSAVSLVLKDGSHIGATTSDGWFAAWWPGGEEAQSAKITTTTGISTQQLIP